MQIISVFGVQLVVDLFSRYKVPACGCRVGFYMNAITKVNTTGQ